MLWFLSTDRQRVYNSMLGTGRKKDEGIRERYKSYNPDRKKNGLILTFGGNFISTRRAIFAMIEPDTADKRDRPTNSPFPSVDDSDVIGPILDNIDAPDTVRSLAIKIASSAESTMWIVGKRRSTVAASSVYVAGCILGESKPLYKQEEVADASSASKSSIINQYQDLRAIFKSTDSVPELNDF